MNGIEAGIVFHHVREGVKYRYEVVAIRKAETTQHIDWIELQNSDDRSTMEVEWEWFRQRNIKFVA